MTRNPDICHSTGVEIAEVLQFIYTIKIATSRIRMCVTLHCCIPTYHALLYTYIPCIVVYLHTMHCVYLHTMHCCIPTYHALLYTYIPCIVVYLHTMHCCIQYTYISCIVFLKINTYKKLGDFTSIIQVK